MYDGTDDARLREWTETRGKAGWREGVEAAQATADMLRETIATSGMCGFDSLEEIRQLLADAVNAIERLVALIPPPADAGRDAEIEELRAALASDARVDAILAAVLTSSNDPELGTRDHLPRVLRDFLSEECGRAGLIGWNDGYAEGYAKARADAALRADSTPSAAQAEIEGRG